MKEVRYQHEPREDYNPVPYYRRGGVEKNYRVHEYDDMMYLGDSDNHAGTQLSRPVTGRTDGTLERLERSLLFIEVTIPARREVVI